MGTADGRDLMYSLDPHTLQQVEELSAQRDQLVDQRAEMLHRLRDRRCAAGGGGSMDLAGMHHSITHLGLAIRRIDTQIDALLDGAGPAGPQ